MLLPRVPVNSIDLPQAHIIGSISVVICCIGVARALVRHNALAATLIRLGMHDIQTRICYPDPSLQN